MWELYKHGTDVLKRGEICDFNTRSLGVVAMRLVVSRHHGKND
jgi:hypothetical protein